MAVRESNRREFRCLVAAFRPQTCRGVAATVLAVVGLVVSGLTAEAAPVVLAEADPVPPAVSGAPLVRPDGVSAAILARSSGERVEVEGLRTEV